MIFPQILPIAAEKCFVERRREHRFAAVQTASIIVLDPNGGQADVRMNGQLAEVSGRGARLLTNEPIPVGAAIRVDVDDHSLLGEVCHCSKARDGYLCGIEVDQVLSHVRDLAKLMEAVLGEKKESPAERSELVELRRRK